MAVHDPSKIDAGVRFPSPAPEFHFRIFGQAIGGRCFAPPIDFLARRAGAACQVEGRAKDFFGNNLLVKKVFIPCGFVFALPKKEFLLYNKNILNRQNLINKAQKSDKLEISMEKEPLMEASQFEFEQAERFGRNVEIHAIFLRHGEKGEGGELTEAGRKQADEFGEQLERKDAIKGYSSPAKRVIETVERVIASAPHDRKLATRIRTEIGISPSISKEFVRQYREREKEGPDAAAEWYLSFGHNRPDAETSSPYENAQALAYILRRYVEMADRLYSGSKIDLINGTHQGLPEALLKEILVRQVDGKRVVGFESLQEIGGALRPAEGMEFLIKTDASGGKVVKLNFRGNTFDLDTEKLNALADDYEKRQKTKR